MSIVIKSLTESHRPETCVKELLELTLYKFQTVFHQILISGSQKSFSTESSTSWLINAWIIVFQQKCFLGEEENGLW